MIDKQQIIKLRAEGLTQKRIGELFKCSQTQVWRVLKAHGLTGQVTPVERLQNRLKTNKKSGCWEFQGSRMKKGYGQISVNGVSHLAHRLAYSSFVGEIPEGLHVLHKCDNPSCCNPDHLFVGTNAENMADKISKGRQAKGSDYPNAKVSPSLIRQCLELKKSGIKNAQIAKILGVCPSTVGVWLKQAISS